MEKRREWALFWGKKNQLQLPCIFTNHISYLSTRIIKSKHSFFFLVIPQYTNPWYLFNIWSFPLLSVLYLFFFTNHPFRKVIVKMIKFSYEFCLHKLHEECFSFLSFPKWEVLWRSPSDVIFLTSRLALRRTTRDGWPLKVMKANHFQLIIDFQLLYNISLSIWLVKSCFLAQLEWHRKSLLPTMFSFFFAHGTS